MFKFFGGQGEVIILMRYPEMENDVVDPPITSWGLKQAEELAKLIKDYVQSGIITQISSSCKKRATQTRRIFERSLAESN